MPIDALESQITLTLPITERDHLLGPAEATITLLEYGDYECPTCEIAYPIVKQVLKEMGSAVRFAFRNFPVSSVHPHAAVAAQAAEAAAAQKKFWPMHDILYEHQKDLADHDITHFALLIGLEMYRFDSDISSERFVKRVTEDYESGQSSGVKKTPTFFVNGRKYVGKLDVQEMIQMLSNMTG
jgi:protein-disulfide isomerase